MIPKHVVDATVQVTGAIDVFEKGARRAFTCGRVSLSAGEICFLVKSSRFPSRFYIVVWDEGALSWLCSCGAGYRDHAHTRKAGQHARTKLQEEAKVAQKSSPLPQDRQTLWKKAWKRQKEAERASWQNSHQAAQEIAHMGVATFFPR